MHSFVSQFYISDSNLPLSDYLKHCIAQIKLGYSNFEHTIHDKDSLREIYKKPF
jgi:hypothetical protein